LNGNLVQPSGFWLEGCDEHRENLVRSTHGLFAVDDFLPHRGPPRWRPTGCGPSRARSIIG
jgi:hypothetical protein